MAAGQTASDGAGGESLGARRLIREFDVAGRVLTLDALHGCPKAAEQVVAEGADSVLPVKGNRKYLLDDLKGFNADFNAAPPARTLHKVHGRIEERTCTPGPDPWAVRRPRTPARTPPGVPHHPPPNRDPNGKDPHRSRPRPHLPRPDRAGPAEILALNRGHREMENRLPCVRDFSCDGDRSRICTGALPRNLAGLANAALSSVRLRGRFPYLPQTQRHYAAPRGEALREVTRAN